MCGVRVYVGAGSGVRLLVVVLGRTVGCGDAGEWAWGWWLVDGEAGCDIGVAGVGDGGTGTGGLCARVAGGRGWVGGAIGKQCAGCGGGVEGVGVVGGWAGVGGQGVGLGACVVCGYRWGWL